MPVADAPDLLSSFPIETTLNMTYMLIKQCPDELNQILFNVQGHSPIQVLG